MDEQLFRKGKSFIEYAKSTEMEETYRNFSLSPQDERFFSSFTVKVFVISEHWCKDCKREVPLIASIADKVGWEMRIFSRDENPHLMEEYATDGKEIIPVFVFFDRTFTEIGRFIEQAPEGKTTIEVLKETLTKSPTTMR